MINNLRVIKINSKGTVHIQGGGEGGGHAKNIGCKGGSPENSFKFCIDGIGQ